ncbi:hypothetical protein RND71_042260 [Anisodus tanguticus]|uniref:Uncharacterized protein n=1 Tax=Anisodus tanguticus TaxID=243964 RepID=A0AAE1QS64_9SOLA|nr:hypothetical protein RND71_042260 [Anisodus tanguticus]
MTGKKKSGSSSFSIFNIFKSKSYKSRMGDQEYYSKDDFVKAYKVWPSDEDRGLWVAEPGIDKKASTFISIRTANWSNVESSN